MSQWESIQGASYEIKRFCNATMTQLVGSAPSEYIISGLTPGQQYWLDPRYLLSQPARAPEDLMECPKCGLLNPDEAQRCDCGYDFQTKTNQPSYLADVGGKNSLHRSAQTRLSVVVAAGFCGVVFGAVAGFCLAFVLIGVVIGGLPSRPFGETAGVAAIDFGMFLGVPLGAILGGSLCIYVVIRNNRR